MSGLDRRDIEVLKKAVKDRHGNETLERALGRAIRNDKGDFKRYIKIISEVREHARKKRINVIKAAKTLVKG